MAAQTFIGRQISLTSSSDIRYTGTLEGIDQQNSTITLKNVFSMGTEHRRPPGQPDYIPPSHQPYEEIVFKAANVKDISVDDHAPRPLPNDPAVLSGQAGPQVGAAHYPAYGGGFAPQAVPPPQMYNNAQPQVPLHVPQTHQPQTGNRQQRQQRTPPEAANGRQSRAPRQQDGVRAAEASLETGGGHRGGRGGHRSHDPKPTPVPVPDVDFDFQQSNARFNKAALAPPRAVEDDQKTNPSDSDSDDKSKERDKYYNPQKSFFDGLSLTAPPPPQGNRGGRRPGRGGGGRGRNRREEEREKNISTFGEPGGVGIMGPGAYVAGWGGGHGGRRGRGGGGGHVAAAAGTASATGLRR